MTDDNPLDVFDGGRHVATASISRMVELFESVGSTRLVLPSIQRSLVWRNSQIVNFWDSLLRGFPIGMMTVVKATSGTGIRNSNGKTTEAAGNEYALFDGQQRLAAFMLGIGKGPLRATRQLWVDVSKKCGPGDNLFTLRINSTGQPYGYQIDKPDAKLGSATLRAQYEAWPKVDGSLQSSETVFREISGKPTTKLGRSSFAIPLEVLVQAQCVKDKLNALVREASVSSGHIDITDFANCLKRALNAEIVLNLVDSSLLEGSNYSLLFERLGQSATRLSDEELTYSLIKKRFPYVHDRIAEITDRDGRFASSVDLVLGALRIARLRSCETSLPPDGPDGKRDQAIQAAARRPAPRDVTSLGDGSGNPTSTEITFFHMLPRDANAPRILQKSVAALRRALAWNGSDHDVGLPLTLLARLPRDLLDVLLLFMMTSEGRREWAGEDRSALVAFTLHWLIFVEYDDKAADLVFARLLEERWTPDARGLARLLIELAGAGLARHAPRPEDWCKLMKEADEEASSINAWDGRFSTGDVGKHKPSLSLRVLSTHPELIRRMLLWLQRAYIQKRFPSFDPLSVHDEDLPLDLDHVIPAKCFYKANLVPSSVTSDDRRRRLHEMHCNSLGNFRWLAAPDNRSRQDAQLEPENGIEHLTDHIDRAEFNAHIERVWDAAAVDDVYRSINLRTLNLCRMFMRESGIDKLLDLTDGEAKAVNAK